MIKDASNRWTPIRWIRHKLTGSPLTEHEKWKMERWKEIMIDRGDLGKRPYRYFEYDYLLSLEKKYD